MRGSRDGCSLVESLRKGLIKMQKRSEAREVNFAGLSGLLAKNNQQRNWNQMSDVTFTDSCFPHT